MSRARQGVLPKAELRVGTFKFDPARSGLIDADGTVRRLRPKAFKLLDYLMQHASLLLSRDELTKVIWPGVDVTDDSLTQLVREIRRAMNDVGGAILQTVSGRGYMLAAEVHAEPALPATLPGAELLPMGHPTTSFIGRQRELAELTALVGLHRLVTITGMGGIGKTRLMQKLVADRNAGDRLLWVDLALVDRAADLPFAVSAGIGLGEVTLPIDQAVVALLRHRRGTLLIDNAEHLVAEAGALIQAVLAECRDISILVTSRVTLGIAGEAVYRLEALPFPPGGHGLTAAKAMEFDAVRLFVERAQLLLPGFRLEEAQPKAVAAICRRLDGIALAIEMAVPRLQVLTAEQFLQRLDNRFQLLGSRGGGARQRSLRHMMEWSWELLSKADRDLLTLLSVFAASVSLTAITSMRPIQDVPDWAVVEGLMELVRSSLLIADPDPAEPRYRLLETTRAFAVEQISELEAQALRRQHLHVMIGVFEAAEHEWPVLDGSRWIQRYGPDADNLRSALSWALGPGNETELALRLIAASYPLWWELPGLPLGEGRRWFDIAVTRIGPATPAGVQGRLWLGLSLRDIADGDRQAGDSARRAVVLLRDQAEPLLLGAALWRAGCGVLRDDTADKITAVLDEAIVHLRSWPPTKWLALALVRRGDVLASTGDLQGALPHYNEAFALAEHTGQRLALQYAACGLSELMFRIGARADASMMLRRVRREVPGPAGLPLMSVLAAQLAAQDRITEALEAIGDVLGCGPETGLPSATILAMETLAMVVAEGGNLKAAARMLGYVLTHYGAARRRTGGRSVMFNRLDAALQGGLRQDEIENLLSQGAAWAEPVAREVAALHYGWLTASVPGQTNVALSAQAAEGRPAPSSQLQQRDGALTSKLVRL